MKSLMLLWQKVADELATWCCTNTVRDVKTVTDRTKTEGLSFLTITLPGFGKDFERSLDLGRVDPSLFVKFHRREGRPMFLSGFLDQVFERGTGLLLDEPSIDAIFAVRQLTLMFGKIYGECTSARVRRTFDKFVECEAIVRDCTSALTDSDILEFRQMSSLLWRDLFTASDKDVYEGRLLPRHSNGTTAAGLLGNEKFDDKQWTARLEGSFPSEDFLIPSWRHFDRLADVYYRDPGAEEPVRVTTVPKTLKAPRIIAIEPVCMMYAQQAIWRCLGENLRNDHHRFLVDWTTQEPNQALAQLGSSDGSLATLDLSDASDRVSNLLVVEMLSNWPSLADAVTAARSMKADVPGHGVITLSKFASMGSALCFPLESLVFATCVFLGIQDELSRPLTRSDIQSLRGKVRLFGDDIIVPVEYVRCVVERLEAFGLKVNRTKSFWTGRFRESCGKEFYAGQDVSIVKVRREFSARHMDAAEKVSVYSMRNQFYLVGLWKTAQWLDNWIERFVKFNPTVHPTSPVQGRWTLFFDYQVDKLHHNLHSPLVKGYVVDPKLPPNSVDDVGALLKVFLRVNALEGTENRSGLGTVDSDCVRHWTEALFPMDVDPEHLLRSGRPVAVDIKLRHGSPF